METRPIFTEYSGIAPALEKRSVIKASVLPAWEPSGNSAAVHAVEAAGAQAGSQPATPLRSGARSVPVAPPRNPFVAVIATVL